MRPEGMCSKGLHDLSKPGALALVMGGHWACRECMRNRMKRKAKLKVTKADRGVPELYTPSEQIAQPQSQ